MALLNPEFSRPQTLGGVRTGMPDMYVARTVCTWQFTSSYSAIRR
jgi:hypothetical protein